MLPNPAFIFLEQGILYCTYKVVSLILTCITFFSTFHSILLIPGLFTRYSVHNRSDLMWYLFLRLFKRTYRNTMVLVL